MNKFNKIFEGIYYCRTLYCEKCPYYNEDETAGKDALCKKNLLNDTMKLLDKVASIINYSLDETK